jgi:hypothetical protein
MAIDYGTDFSIYPDLDWGKRIDGPKALVQAIARSIEDAQLGVDLRDWLNADLGPADVYNLEETIRSRCLVDERVESSTVKVTQPSRLELQIAIFLTLAEGPFRLVLKVTQLGVQILTES